jgi:Arc/MetJ family transcription regulator
MCNIFSKEPGVNMATNLAIDDNLLNIAKNISKHKTKRAVVNEALHEYIQRRKQFEITKLFGKVEYDEEYDYKKQRNAK